MASQDLSGVGVDFALRDDSVSCAFEAQIESPDSGK
jgi:hypothetical protein